MSATKLRCFDGDSDDAEVKIDNGDHKNGLKGIIALTVTSDMDKTPKRNRAQLAAEDDEWSVAEGTRYYNIE